MKTEELRPEDENKKAAPAADEPADDRQEDICTENDRPEDAALAVGALDADGEAKPLDETADEGEDAPSKPLEPPKFVVKTVLNAKSQQEASEAVMPKSMKVMNYVMIGLMVAAAGILLWQYIVTKSQANLVMFIFAALLTAYLIYSRLTMSKKALRRWEESMQRSFGSNELHLCAEFYTYSMVQTLDEDEAVAVEGYSELSGVVESEHLFLLRRSRQQWFFIAKDGFTTGTAEEFRSFINERIGGK